MHFIPSYESSWCPLTCNLGAILRPQEGARRAPIAGIIGNLGLRIEENLTHGDLLSQKWLEIVICCKSNILYLLCQLFKYRIRCPYLQIWPFYDHQSWKLKWVRQPLFFKHTVQNQHNLVRSSNDIPIIFYSSIGLRFWKIPPSVPLLLLRPRSHFVSLLSGSFKRTAKFFAIENLTNYSSLWRACNYCSGRACRFSSFSGWPQ